MVKLEPIDLKELPEEEYAPMSRAGSHGRVSWPILQMFMDSKDDEGNPVYIAHLDKTGISKKPSSLKSNLRIYIINHRLPVKVIQRGQELYLQRTDIDEHGNMISQEEIIKKAIVLTPQRVKEMIL